MTTSANEWILQFENFQQSPAPVANNKTCVKSLTRFKKIWQNHPIILTLLLNLIILFILLFIFIHFSQTSLRLEEKIEILKLNSNNYVDAEQLQELRNEIQNFTATFSHWLTQIEQNIQNKSLKNSSTLEIFEQTLEQLAEDLNTTDLLRPQSCHQIQQHSTHPDQNKVYKIYPYPHQHPNQETQTQCDFTTEEGHWTIIQRRNSGPMSEFYRNWTDYEDGFGSANSNYWIGLKAIHALTLTPQILRIDLEDEEEQMYGNYEAFSVSAASDYYRLSIGQFSGTSGDALVRQNGKRFSTFDRDNDGYHINCAEARRGAWWYVDCSDSNLNGLYHEGGDTVDWATGIYWDFPQGSKLYQSLKSTRMMIRPRVLSGY